MQTPFDPLAQRYPSQRYPIYARGGMVNTSSPQASTAGLAVLQKGGNAIDAAVAAAATLTVTEPTSCGLGSDAFAIVWSAKEQRLFGLNSSGPAPMLSSAERILAEGRDDHGRMPTHGWTPVTVPGAPKAWAELTLPCTGAPPSGAIGKRSPARSFRHGLKPSPQTERAPRPAI